MAAAGSYSHCRPRDCCQCWEQNSDLIENLTGEKTLGTGGRKQRQQANSPSPTSLWDSQERVTEVDSYSHCRLREECQRWQQNSDLIEKLTHEKTLGIGGKETKTAGKLTVAYFSMGFARGGWQQRAPIPIVD